MKHPAYHLRSNKAIDRCLLLNALELWNVKYGISSFSYYGMGGPYLDDVRLLSQQFPALRYVSIESNTETHKRQKYHQNTKNLVFIGNDMNSYIKQEFPSDTQSIFWLDYTDIRVKNFSDFIEVLQRVGDGSVVKLTMRASADYPLTSTMRRLLSTPEAESISDNWISDFNMKYGAYLPRVLTVDDVVPSEFIALLQEMIRLAAQKALPASTGNTFQLIHSCQYTDGTPMLSITGIVCCEDTKKQVRECYRKWEHSNLDWDAPHLIDVPDLSVKERFKLEKYLPMTGGEGKVLQARLGYKIDNSQYKSERKLLNYQQYHRLYPLFAKVSV